MDDQTEYFDVKFTARALREMNVILREMDPNAPDSEEVILKMAVGPCKHCGSPPKDGLGACDPVGITEDGVIFGDTICKDCLEKGL